MSRSLNFHFDFQIFVFHFLGQKVFLTPLPTIRKTVLLISFETKIVDWQIENSFRIRLFIVEEGHLLPLAFYFYVLLIIPHYLYWYLHHLHPYLSHPKRKNSYFIKLNYNIYIYIYSYVIEEFFSYHFHDYCCCFI